MKHVIPMLVAASALVAAVLSACGGNEANGAHTPDTPPLDGGGPSVLLAQATHAGALRWDPTYELPDGPTTGPKLKLVMHDDVTAWICTERSTDILCAVIDAPLPPHTKITDWSENGTLALGYTLTESTATLDQNAILTFQAAANGAVAAVIDYATAHLSADDADCNPALKAGNSNRKRECGPIVEIPGTPPGGRGGGGGGGGGDPGGGDPAPDPGAPPPPSDNPDIPVVVVHGSPEPVSTMISASISAGNLWTVPNNDQLQQLASPAPKAKCINGGIAIVCIRGQRPADEMPGPVYWWPQKMCNWSHIFCSDGQEQVARDDERIPGSDVCGKELDELYAICDAQDTAFITQCNLNYRLKVLDYRGFLACGQRASSKLSACRQTARRLTNNGEYPAKCD